jgi:glucose-1-phosphate thymidylyltransferase
MISVSLAAGYATRLYPLTENFPKPLLEVGGTPILERLLTDIDGIDEVTRHVVISNHKFIGHFENWRAATRVQKPVFLLDDGSTANDNRLGAVRDVLLAIESLSLDDDLLVIAGDNCLDSRFRSSRIISNNAAPAASCATARRTRTSSGTAACWCLIRPFA